MKERFALLAAYLKKSLQSAKSRAKKREKA